LAEAVAVIDKSPVFLRSADFLRVEEKSELALAEADASDEIILRAKQMAVDHFRRLRDNDPAEGSDDGGLPSGSVTRVFQACVKRILDDQRAAKLDSMFADPDRLFAAVLAKLKASKSLSDAVVAGHPVAEVLAERLKTVPPPEFALLAAALLDADPAKRWLAAMNDTKKPSRRRK
jgi:hypothetical protein